MAENDSSKFIDLSTQPLPFSAEAEQSVLGSILIDPASILQVGDILKAEYFYIPQHKAIYLTMSEMFEFNNAIDFITLLERLKSNGTYDEAGGKTYLTQLMQIVPSSANITAYANIVRERFYVRSLILAARKIIEDASEGVSDASMMLDSAEQLIYDIRQGRDTTGLKHIKDVILGETYDRLAKISNPETREQYIGIPTGIGDLDRTITGLNKSDLIIVGARPGMGKTSFALNIVRHVAVAEKRTVCFFSMEMTRDQLAQRMLSNEASIKSEKLRTGEITEQEWRRLTKAGEVLGNAPIYLDESSGVTVPEMKAKIRRLKNVDLVVVDYLGLMHSARRTENRVQEISDITRNLKIMAKELNIPVLVCAQLNRGGADGQKKRPTLTDLRESGSIEQDADIVLFLHREAYYATGDDPSAPPPDESKAECIVAKNRHGETRTVELAWDGQFTRFVSVDNRYGGDQ